MSTPKKNYYEVQIPLGLMSKIAISQKKLIVNWPNLFAWLVCSIFARLFFKICTTLIIHYTYPWKYIVHGKTNRLLPNLQIKGYRANFYFLCFYNFFKKGIKGLILIVIPLAIHQYIPINIDKLDIRVLS